MDLPVGLTGTCTRHVYTHTATRVSSRIHQNATRQISSELSKACRSESLRDSSKVGRRGRVRARAPSRGRQVDQRASLEEKEQLEAK